MDEKITVNSRPTTKAEFVARITNGMISELINRCRREEGIRDYFNMVAIGYCDDRISSLISDNFDPVTPSWLATRDVPRINHLEERRLANGHTILGNFEQSMWVRPNAAGNTPMYKALVKAHNVISRWTTSPGNRYSFPPVVINISDGEATDADHERLTELASGIKAMSTDDGGALLINIHITADQNLQQVVFPCSVDELPQNRNAHALYHMSSPMPEFYNRQILEIRQGGASGLPFRGVSYNTPVTELVAMMNIGSSSVNLVQ